MTLDEMRQKARDHEARRGWSREYPRHAIIDHGFHLSAATRMALERFRDASPFRSAPEVYLVAVTRLYADLAAAYGVPAPTLTHAGAWHGDSGSSCYTPAAHAVTLRGHASVITALHEWMHARGYGETAAVWWSVNTFRTIWPRSFARLQPVSGSHVMRRPAA
jgi:hypothetical protein